MNSIINHLGSKGIDTGIAELGVYEGTFKLAINNTFANGTSTSLQLLGIDTAVGLQWVSGTVDAEPPGYYTTESNSLYLDSQKLDLVYKFILATRLLEHIILQLNIKLYMLKKQGETEKDYFASSTAKIPMVYPTQWIKVA